MTINELQNNVIEEFADFDDWMDKYALLIDLGNSLPPLEEKYKTESNLIEGCQSRVWLQADYVDGKILFKGESDAVLVLLNVDLGGGDALTQGHPHGHYPASRCVSVCPALRHAWWK